MSPGHWMNETTGQLQPVIIAYLEHKPLDARQIAIMRAYLRQWIAGPYRGVEIDTLRADVDNLVTREAIEEWLDFACRCGIDPL